MARRSRLGAVCCDKFRFGSVSQGTAVEARYDELRFVQAGRGWVSYGESCYVAAVKARLVGSSWVTVGRGGLG